MLKKATPRADGDERALLTLFRAIAARKPTEAMRLVRRSPALAARSIRAGATRANASSHYFADIGHYAYAGDTALHMAAAAYQRDLARELVGNGANPSARNRRGAEPLHYAADGMPDSAAWNPKAQAAVIETLIAAGADPNARDKTGVAPLHRAVRTRSAAAVRALLEHGANARLKNGSGSTPLHLAVQCTGRGGSGSAAARRQQQDIIRCLLDHGARPADEDGRGKTAADCATADWIRELL